MSKVLELQGQTFGRLKVKHRIENNKSKQSLWLCECACGKTASVVGAKLKSGWTQSCGRLRDETGKNNITHGCTVGGKVTQEYLMFHSAKARAKDKELPFDLDLEDIVIPEFCPVFTDIKLVRTNNTKYRANSPSLDRITPELGYTKDNVCVISYRANAMKQDASLEEIKRLAEWLEGELNDREQCRASRGAGA